MRNLTAENSLDVLVRSKKQSQLSSAFFFFSSQDFFALPTLAINNRYKPDPRANEVLHVIQAALDTSLGQSLVLVPPLFKCQEFSRAALDVWWHDRGQCLPPATRSETF